MSVLWDSLRSTTFRWAIVEVVLVGALGGVVGVHVLLRRLPFFVVAMSHAMFPGVVLASVLGLSLFLGGARSVSWWWPLSLPRRVKRARPVQRHRRGAGRRVRLRRDGAVGPARSSRDLSAFLVGSILTVTPGDVPATVAGGGLVVVVLAALHKELVPTAFDPAGSAALGYPVRRLDTLVLAAVTMTMATRSRRRARCCRSPCSRCRPSPRGLDRPRRLDVGDRRRAGAASGLLGLAASTCGVSPPAAPSGWRRGVLRAVAGGHPVRAAGGYVEGRSRAAPPTPGGVAGSAPPRRRHRPPCDLPLTGVPVAAALGPTPAAPPFFRDPGRHGAGGHHLPRQPPPARGPTTRRLGLCAPGR